MKCLGLAGFLMDETYPIIKAISKKKTKVIDAAKERFLKGFSEHIMRVENTSKSAAEDVAGQVWRVIIDSSRYAFGAAHAVAVALDALYGAYLKAHYPYEYYSTLLDDYSAAGNKDKVALIKAEMKRAFGITLVPARFRQDNRTFFVDKEHKQMSDALTSVKFISRPVADALYKMKDIQFDSFISLLIALDDDPAFNSRAIEILIRMDYFQEFGHAGKLLNVFHEFREGDMKWGKKYVDKTKAKRLEYLKRYEQNAPETDIPVAEQLSFECVYYGAPLSVFPEERKRYVVLDVNTSYSPKLKIYGISTGKTGTVKIHKKNFADNPLEVGDVITVTAHKKTPAYSYVNGERKIRPGVEDVWLMNYTTDYHREEGIG